jgi:hypothetical protein
MKWLVISGVILFVARAFAGGPVEDRISRGQTERTPVTERTVFITGSLIPQRIKVRRVGTTSFSPLRVIDRQEIDQTGRHTTPGAFVNDRSLRIIGH